MDYAVIVSAVCLLVSCCHSNRLFSCLFRCVRAHYSRTLDLSISANFLLHAQSLIQPLILQQEKHNMYPLRKLLMDLQVC